MNTMRSEPEIERALDRLHRADRHAIQAALEDVTEADRAAARAFVAAHGRASPRSARWSVLRSPWTVALPAALLLAGVFVLVPWRGNAPTGADFLSGRAVADSQRLAVGQVFDLGLPVGYLDRVELTFVTVDAAGAEQAVRTLTVPDDRTWIPQAGELDGLPTSGIVRVRVEHTNRMIAEVMQPYTR